MKPRAPALIDLPLETPDVVSAGLGQLVIYAHFLATAGVERGLIGPREIDRLWPRHLLNCAAVADPAAGLLPDSASVIDVGSGAGLPGIVWGIVRPDLRIQLVEPMRRRVEFLEEALAVLSLGDRIEVLRARAPELPKTATADIVTARALAPLSRLAAMLLPLVTLGGSMVAFKGENAEAEIQGAQQQLARLGAESARVVTCGSQWLEHPTTVVIAKREAAGTAQRIRGGSRGRSN